MTPNDSPQDGRGLRLRGLEPERWNDDVRAVLTAALENVRRITAGERIAGDAPASDPLPTLTLIAHQQHLLAPFLGWAGPLALKGDLPRADAELVALRTAWSCRSLFEWREHRNYALMAGLTAEQIDALAEGPAAPLWTSRQRAILRAADDLHYEATITPATWDALAAELTPGEMVEVVLVVGQYRMLSSLVNAAGTDAVIGAPPEADVVGRRIADALADKPWQGSEPRPTDRRG